jgi:hypothetical protein
MKTSKQVVWAAWVLVAAGCGAARDLSTDDTTSVTELGAAAISGAVNATEEGGAMASLAPRGLLDRMGEVFTVESTAHADGSCPTVANGGACDGNGILLAYNQCRFGAATATWNGSQTIQFTQGTCSPALLSGAATFTRTFGAGTTRTSENGTVVTLDTTTPSGYATPVSGGTTVVVSNPGLGVNRDITVSGLHLTAVGAVRNRLGREVTRTVWDHSLNGSLQVVGRGAARKVAVGSTMTVQHNLALYTGTLQVTRELGFTAGCCHPTSGEITATLSGSRTGTEDVVFGPTCGEATRDGEPITLRHCF